MFFSRKLHIKKCITNTCFDLNNVLLTSRVSLKSWLLKKMAFPSAAFRWMIWKVEWKEILSRRAHSEDMDMRAISHAYVVPLLLSSSISAAVEILEHFMLFSMDKLYGDADFFFHVGLGSCLNHQYMMLISISVQVGYFQSKPSSLRQKQIWHLWQMAYNSYKRASENVLFHQIKWEAQPSGTLRSASYCESSSSRVKVMMQWQKRRRFSNSVSCKLSGDAPQFYLDSFSTTREVYCMFEPNMWSLLCCMCPFVSERFPSNKIFIKTEGKSNMKK